MAAAAAAQAVTHAPPANFSQKAKLTDSLRSDSHAAPCMRPAPCREAKRQELLERKRKAGAPIVVAVLPLSEVSSWLIGGLIASVLLIH